LTYTNKLVHLLTCILDNTQAPNSTTAAVPNTIGMAELVVGPGGAGSAARTASFTAFRRANSNSKLSNPFAIAH
jgi:hypothetical protein